MNPDYLPPLGRCLRTLGEFAARHEVNDVTLAEIAAELDRARSLVASALGVPQANRCARHVGGPVDPTAENGCLLCGNQTRRPAPPVPDDITPGEVLRFLTEHDQDAATARYGARAVTHALAIRNRRPSTQRSDTPAGPPRTEGDDR